MNIWYNITGGVTIPKYDNVQNDKPIIDPWDKKEESSEKDISPKKLKKGEIAEVVVNTAEAAIDIAVELLG